MVIQHRQHNSLKELDNHIIKKHHEVNLEIGLTIRMITSDCFLFLKNILQFLLLQLPNNEYFLLINLSLDH